MNTDNNDGTSADPSLLSLQDVMPPQIIDTNDEIRI